VEPFAPLVLQRPVIRLIDQTLLPHEERWRTISTVGELQEAIRALRVRGAPLLGIAGAAGMALAAETGLVVPVSRSMTTPPAEFET